MSGAEIERCAKLPDLQTMRAQLLAVCCPDNIIIASPYIADRPSTRLPSALSSCCRSTSSGWSAPWSSSRRSSPCDFRTFILRLQNLVVKLMDGVLRPPSVGASLTASNNSLACPTYDMQGDFEIDELGILHALPTSGTTTTNTTSHPSVEHMAHGDPLAVASPSDFITAAPIAQTLDEQATDVDAAADDDDIVFIPMPRASRMLVPVLDAVAEERESRGSSRYSHVRAVASEATSAPVSVVDVGKPRPPSQPPPAAVHGLP